MKIINILIAALACHLVHAANTGVELDLKLKIISVPDYVFGSATYATPVKYTIEGCDKAEISDETYVTFKYEKKSVTKTITGLFVANDGPTKSNGTTTTYTAIVPSEIYKGQLCEDHKCFEAQYILQVSFYPYKDSKKYEKVTLTSDLTTGKIAKRYIDERAYCVEIPTAAGIYKDYVDVSTDKLHKAETKKDGEIKYTDVKHGVEVEPTNLGIGGFEGGFGLTGGVQCGSKLINQNGEIASITDMIHDNDWLGGAYGGTLYRAEALGARDGSTFFTSYGGRYVDKNVYAGPVMDLNCVKGSFDYEYCTGAVSIYFGSSRSTGMGYAGKASGFFGIGWALLPGPWGATFGTVSSIFAIMATASLDDVEASGDAIVNFGFQKNADGHSVPQFFKTINTEPGAPIMFNDAGIDCLVGEEFSFVIQVDSGGTLETLPNNSWGHIRSYSKAAFYSEPSDLYTMSIHTSR